ncbi:MAG: pre-peptidase C-terminal domain-containing protein [Deltaproteobacteria bacterium]|nr:pre-peptidase C-terminal domain-containing protein [Deltaproteobacteria bacterium]
MSRRQNALSKWIRRLGPLALAGLAVACDDQMTDDPGVDPTKVDSEKPVGKAAGKADQWGPSDNPTIFTPDLDLSVAALPLEGEAANIPWASSYWPVHEDTIAHRWDGASSDSPAMKYGKAFNVADLEAKVSKAYGIDRYTSRKACKATSECDATIGESCSIRPGATEGRCIPTWWGLCHAWAPASILEPEPIRPVTRNGVTFKVNDIKALVTMVYNHSTSKFVSLRCDKDDSQNKITYDAYGRPVSTDAECKDTNAGTYHVLLTNYLGLRGQSFVEDRTFDDEVWNQPLRGYRVTQLKEVTAQEANRLVGVTADPASLDLKTFAGANLAAGAWFHQPAFTVVPGTTVKVEMTGDQDVDLYVKVGAQPTASAYDCRPYAGGSAETCEVQIPAGATQLFVSVNAYTGPAKYDVKVSIPKTVTGVPTKYLFNDKAAKFFHTKLEVDYITESSSSTDGNLGARIDDYTRTDRYEYILEVDANGKINGGEWLGSSKRNHPDFLWLPTGRASTSIAGGAITSANVKSILDESVAPVNPGGGSTSTALIEENVTLAQNEWRHFGPYTDVASAFSAVMTGTGDADLYVKRGAQPTTTSYDCRPYGGNSEETCSGATAGSYWVSVHGYKASQVKVTIRYTKTGGSTGGTTTPVAHLDQSGSVAQGAMLYYTVNVKAGKAIVVRTTAASDIDLYVRMNLAPTVTTYDQRGYTASGNETLTVVPGADGVLHIGVHGYAASSFTLKTADQ